MLQKKQQQQQEKNKIQVVLCKNRGNDLKPLIPLALALTSWKIFRFPL